MTEIYRMILCGEVQGQTLRSFSMQALLESSCKKVPGNTSHSREWLDLASLVARDGETMHETVQQYFNIVQGGGGSIVVLNEPAFNEKLSRLKNKKLQIPEEKLNLEDPVKLRRDVYAKAKDIMDRVDKVAQKELEKAYLILQEMSNGDYGYFGKGDTGYAQYMTAFNRNFGGSSGGGGGGGNHNNNGGGGGDGSGCGCLIAIAVVVVLILIVLGG